MHTNFLKEEKWLLMLLKIDFFPLPKRPPSFQEEDESKDKELIPLEKRLEYTVNEFNKLIVEKRKSISKEFFKERFQGLIDMQRELYKIKSANTNKDLVNVIKSGLRDLKEEINEMPKDETEYEKSNEIVNFVEKIFEFTNQNQNQEGQGLKILTPEQMLSRLTITLAQLRIEDNSEKLKNGVRQLLYSLYRSKKLTKTIYNNSIDTI